MRIPLFSKVIHFITELAGPTIPSLSSSVATREPDAEYYAGQNVILRAQLQEAQSLIGSLHADLALLKREHAGCRQNDNEQLQLIGEQRLEIEQMAAEAANLREQVAALSIDLERALERAAGDEGQGDLAGPFEGSDPDDEEPEKVLVYDGVSEFAMQIVRLSFRETNKWFLSLDGSFEISARIMDQGFLARIAEREVLFGAGDVARFKLRTLSHRRGNGPISSEFTILEVLAIIPPPLQAPLAMGGVL